MGTGSHVVFSVVQYVMVIIRALEMYDIYGTEARGCEAARGLSAIDAIHPECLCYVEILVCRKFGDFVQTCLK